MVARKSQHSAVGEIVFIMEIITTPVFFMSYHPQKMQIKCQGRKKIKLFGKRGHRWFC
jgi:hypothetical protein